MHTVCICVILMRICRIRSLTKHKDSKRYVPIWDLRGGGHIRRARRPELKYYIYTLLLYMLTKHKDSKRYAYVNI